MSIMQYVDHRGYFRYDTGDNTTNENEDLYYDLRDELESLGWELYDVQIEHDCITGHVKSLEEDK